MPPFGFMSMAAAAAAARAAAAAAEQELLLPGIRSIDNGSGLFVLLLVLLRLVEPSS